MLRLVETMNRRRDRITATEWQRLHQHIHRQRELMRAEADTTKRISRWKRRRALVRLWHALWLR